MTTAKLALTELANGQANYLNANATFARLDQLVQATVVDKDLNAPPGSPVSGDQYIVGPTPTGAWASQAGKLAYYLSGAWTFVTPRAGWRAAVLDELDAAGAPKIYTYTGSAWVIAITGATLSAVQAFTGSRSLALADVNTYNVSADATAQVATVPAQASVAWTADAEIHFEWAAAGSVTITGAAGVTINGVVAGSFQLSGVGAVATLKRKGLNAWTLVGSLFGALVLSNGQITFPATQVPSANSNTLDDYEEGTWTPVLSFATPGDLSVSYTTQIGKYTKIGNAVTLEFNILTSAFTHTTASGQLQISGQPFSPSAQTANSTLFWSGITKAGFTQVVMLVQTSVLAGRASGSGVAATFIMPADMPSGGAVRLQGSVTYLV